MIRRWYEDHWENLKIDEYYDEISNKLQVQLQNV